MLLEVIASSVRDAVEAERGGAGRLELVRALDRGGLTPAREFLEEVIARVRIPVRVMIREADGFGAGNQQAVDRLAQLASDAAALGVDGIVAGFLSNGRVDVAAMDTIVAAAHPVRVTFHHAFDALPDAAAALRDLRRWPSIDRVLTSGGEGPWTERIARLRELAEAAAPEVRVLVGGGLDLEALRLLARSPLDVEAHVGRAARVPATADGCVSAERVAALVEACVA